jgi:hypothetical protein
VCNWFINRCVVDSDRWGIKGNCPKKRAKKEHQTKSDELTL